MTWPNHCRHFHIWPLNNVHYSGNTIDRPAPWGALRVRGGGGAYLEDGPAGGVAAERRLLASPLVAVLAHRSKVPLARLVVVVVISAARDTGHQNGASTWGVNMGRQHGASTWGVNMGHQHGASTEHQHGASTWGVNMGRQHGASTWGVNMGHQHGASTWGVNTGRQQGVNRASTWGINRASTRGVNRMSTWGVNIGHQHGASTWGINRALTWSINMGHQHEASTGRQQGINMASTWGVNMGRQHGASTWSVNTGRQHGVSTRGVNTGSLPVRLGKGQGAKEIGHNLARERPKIGHSLECKWPSEAHFYAWTTKIRSQSSTRMKRGLGTILWAIDENMGTNLQAVTSMFTSAVKNSNYIL